MFNTKFGAFNGSTWEALLQQVFKKRYASDDYQPMPASPGDFGLEGFTLRTGWCFQCYCPDKHYDRKELYEKQRDKITEDLGKLKKFQAELSARLGSTKLNHWVFVTPEFDRNNLLKHARNKELEVKQWKLPFIADDFCVLLYDGDNYIIELNEIRSATGEALVFDDEIPSLTAAVCASEEYEENIFRKSKARLAEKQSSSNFNNRVQILHQSTLANFLEADGYFRNIEKTAPIVYFRLARLINEFENLVTEKATTWTGSPETLTNQIRDGLQQRITRELSPEFDETNASKVARHMVARWLAICELDYYD